ncbi:MAG TPA: hypothetical protein VL404_09490 [Candidatus Eisenbacteria bacterium]|jgi:hypothetical protein|nr:hypothetical protein [Candidatus Eisenbacteria bacterium]
MHSPRLAGYLLFNLCLVFLLIVNGPRLRRALILEGALPGAASETVRVVQKSHSIRKGFPSSRAEYWVSWSNEDIRKQGAHRLTLPKEKWASTRLTDPLEIVYAGNDPEPAWKGDPRLWREIAWHGTGVLLEIFGLALAAAELFKKKKTS